MIFWRVFFWIFSCVFAYFGFIYLFIPFFIIFIFHCIMLSFSHLFFSYCFIFSFVFDCLFVLFSTFVDHFLHVSLIFFLKNIFHFVFHFSSFSFCDGFSCFLFHGFFIHVLEIVDADIVDETIEVQQTHVVAVGRGPTELEIENHVASGHDQYRIWCDANVGARWIAGRHQKWELGREDEDCWQGWITMIWSLMTRKMSMMMKMSKLHVLNAKRRENWNICCNLSVTERSEWLRHVMGGVPVASSWLSPSEIGKWWSVINRRCQNFNFVDSSNCWVGFAWRPRWRACCWVCFTWTENSDTNIKICFGDVCEQDRRVTFHLEMDTNDIRIDLLQNWQRWTDSWNMTFWMCLKVTRCRVWRICQLPSSGSKISCTWNEITAVCWSVPWASYAIRQHLYHDDRWGLESCRLSKNEWGKSMESCQFERSSQSSLGCHRKRGRRRRGYSSSTSSSYQRHFKRADLRKYDVTISCAACSDSAVHGKTAKPHTTQCRTRIAEQMEHDPEYPACRQIIFELSFCRPE